MEIARLEVAVGPAIAEEQLAERALDPRYHAAKLPGARREHFVGPRDEHSHNLSQFGILRLEQRELLFISSIGQSDAPDFN